MILDTHREKTQKTTQDRSLGNTIFKDSWKGCRQKGEQDAALTSVHTVVGGGSVAGRGGLVAETLHAGAGAGLRLEETQRTRRAGTEAVEGVETRLTRTCNKVSYFFMACRD